MAQVHNALDASLLGKAIRAALGVKDGISTIERFSETLTPTLNLWERLEWAILRGERHWTTHSQAGAVVGELPLIGVSNPANSGLIVVVTGVMWGNPSSAEVLQIRAGANVTFDATGLPQSRDTRLFAQAGLRTISFAHSDAAAQGNLVFQYLHTTVNGTARAYFLPFNFVLAPGFFLGLSTTTTNRTLNGNLIGYERPAQRGELNITGG